MKTLLEYSLLQMPDALSPLALWMEVLRMPSIAL